MVDLNGLGDYQDSVNFDSGVAIEFAAALREAASKVMTFDGERGHAASMALGEFQGFFSQVFKRNMQVASEDAAEFAAAFREAADEVDYLAEEARKEDERRKAVRDYASRHDSWWEKLGDKILGDEEFDPSILPRATPPEKRFVSVGKVSVRQTDTGLRGPSGGVSSAIPESLSGAAREIHAANQQVTPAGVLETDYETFRAKCQYGDLDVGTLFNHYRCWVGYNNDDVTWLEAVAKAFRAAGGSGVISLADAALDAALQSAGVNRDREDLRVDSPTLGGIDPTTGYIEDPVNSATGNFVAPETDLDFGGVSHGLVFSRLYNSTLAAALTESEVPLPGGVLGPGWASTVDQRLLIESGQVRWVRGDGRHIIFPHTATSSITNSTSASADTASGSGESPVWRAERANMWVSQCEGADVTGFDAAGLSGLVWQVSDNEGGRWIFDADGNWLAAGHGPVDLVWVERVDGVITTLRSGWGRALNFTYEQGRLTSVMAGDGRQVFYDYDSQGRLAVVRRPDGVWRYQWDGWLLTEVLDGTGVVQCANTFDSLGRIRTQLVAGGHQTRMVYLPGGVTVADDGDGHHSNTWISDARGRTVGIIDCDGQRTSMLYDAFGNMIHLTDRAGAVTRHSYDGRGRRTRTQLATGGVIEYGWDDCDRLATVSTDGMTRLRLEYEGLDRDPVRAVDAKDNATAMSWSQGLLRELVDATGAKVGFDYDEFGQLSGVTNGVGDTWRILHDQAGRIRETITPLGYRTVLSYDDAGHLVSRVDPDGAHWVYSYDPAGNLETVTAPDGGQTSYTWCPDGQVASITDPAGATTTYAYDGLGDLSAIGLPGGVQWQFLRDAMSRLCQLTDPAGGRWRTNYGVNGDITSVVDPTGVRQSLTTKGHQDQVTNATGRVVAARTWDDYGRLTSTTDVFGATERIDYDECGLPTALTDSTGAITRFDHDAAGRLTTVTSPGGLVHRYGYDATGRLATMTNPAGATTHYHYDADGRLTTRIDPTGETTCHSWDAAGRLTRTTIGDVVTYSACYDACGRPIRIWDPVAATRHFTWDAAGHLISAVDPTGGVHRYAWDKRGRLAICTDATGALTTYRYTDLDQLAEITHPNGTTTKYTWDDAGHLTSHTASDGTTTGYETIDGVEVVTINGEMSTRTSWDINAHTLHIADHTNPDVPQRHTITFDSRGLPLTHITTNDDDVVDHHEWVWDSDRRLIRADDTHSVVSYRYRPDGLPGTITHSRLGVVNLDWDVAGRLVDVRTPDHHDHWDHVASTHSVDGATTRIRRDDHGRVTGLDTPAGAYHYGYDHSGSLVDAAGPRSHHRWVYDAVGRLCSHSVEAEDGSHAETCHTWDSAGRLARTVNRTCDDAVTETCYSYDQCGRRVNATSSDGGRRDYSWDGRGWLAGYTDASHDVITHVNALGNLSDVTADGRCVHVDWDLVTGDPTSIGGRPVLPVPGDRTLGVMSGGGADLWRATTPIESADPYQPVFDSVAGLDDTIGFVGAALSVAGHPWWGVRLYDPATSAFLTPDPAIPPSGALWASNPYNYAANDPLNLIDPTGLHPVTDAQLNDLAHSIDTRSWWNQHKDRILTKEFVGGALLVGVGIAVAATGVGGPFGAAIVSGAFISGGFSMSSQKYSTDKVDWPTVFKEAAIGGAVGGVGAGTSNLVGSQLLKHSNTANAALVKYAANDKVAKAGNGLWAKLNGETAADVALKEAEKSGTDVFEAKMYKKIVGGMASDFTTENAKYGLNAALYDDKHFTAAGWGMVNAKALENAAVDFHKLPAQYLTHAGPGYIEPKGFKQGVVEMGKEAAWSTADNALKDTCSDFMDSATGSYDPSKTGQRTLKHLAKDTGKSLHTGFPAIHADKWRK